MNSIKGALKNRLEYEVPYVVVVYLRLYFKRLPSFVFNSKHYYAQVQVLLDSVRYQVDVDSNEQYKPNAVRFVLKNWKTCENKYDQRWERY